jgi:outer membrane murein-binding lipoprotein Lpp
MKNEDDEYATKRDLKNLKKEIVEEISSLLVDMMTAIDNRFRILEVKVDDLSGRVDDLSADFKAFRKERKMDRLDFVSLKARVNHMAKTDQATEEEVRSLRKGQQQLEQKVTKLARP